MKTFLMYPDRDFDPTPPSKSGQAMQFTQDIELDVLLKAAAADDRYIYDVMTAACAGAWENDIATIRYRQAILQDCLSHPEIVRQFYAIAIEPFGRERSWDFSLFGRDPSAMVASGVRYTAKQSRCSSPLARYVPCELRQLHVGRFSAIL